MYAPYRDPTFEIVAMREAVAQRAAQADLAKSERDQLWRNSAEYRRARQCRIRAALRKALKK